MWDDCYNETMITIREHIVFDNKMWASKDKTTDAVSRYT